MTLNQLKIPALFVWSFTISAIANAGIPVWSLIASQSYPPSATLFPPYESATVQYTVINNSSSPHSLYMVPIQGITPTVTGCSSSPSCIPGAEFCLPSKNSTCTLTLNINSAQLLSSVTKGPELCQYGQTKEGPSKQQCYIPENPLNITLSPSPTSYTQLTVSPRAVIPVNGGSGSLTVTNIGSATAYAVSADLSSLTCSTSYHDIIQNANACTSILAGDSCTLYFTSSTPCLAKGDIPIVGANISNRPTTALATSISDYLVFALSSPSSTLPQVVDNNNQDSGNWAINISISPTTNLFDGFANTANVYADDALAYVQKCISLTSTPTNAWYLPAICQMSATGDAGCTNSISNTINNLVQLGFIVFVDNNQLWSSSISDNVIKQSWAQFWNGTTSSQSSLFWSANNVGRCARSISY